MEDPVYAALARYGLTKLARNTWAERAIQMPFVQRGARALGTALTTNPERTVRNINTAMGGVGGGALGSVVGAGIGAATADPGQRWSGALRGGAIGAGIGGAAGAGGLRYGFNRGMLTRDPATLQSLGKAHAVGHDLLRIFPAPSQT